MEEMAGRAQQAVAREKDIEASLKEYKAKWNTDVAVTREAMKDLVAQMGADTADRWRIGGIAETMGNSLEARDLYNCVHRKACVLLVVVVVKVVITVPGPG